MEMVTTVSPKSEELFLVSISITLFHLKKCIAKALDVERIFSLLNFVNIYKIFVQFLSYFFNRFVSIVIVHLYIAFQAVPEMTDLVSKK